MACNRGLESKSLYTNIFYIREIGLQFIPFMMLRSLAEKKCCCHHSSGVALVHELYPPLRRRCVLCSVTAK